MIKKIAAAGGDPLRWSRKMLNLYWVLFGIGIVAQFAYMWTEPDPLAYMYGLLAPTALFWLIGLSLMELLLRLFHRGGDYIMISGMAYYSFILMVFHYQTVVVVTTCFLPLLVSMFYLRRSKVIFSYALALASYAAMFLIRGYQLPYLAPKHIFIVASSLTVAAYIIDAFMSRSAELERDLRQTLESKQELMIQNTLMDKLAKTDALTGLYNHMTFHEYLDRLIEQSETGQLSLHIALLDIDNFKKTNDTYGHRAGDIVLKRVAETISQSAGAHDFAARYGGEEFAVIFTEKSLDEVVLLLENMRKRIESIHHSELDNYVATVSIGLHAYGRGMGKEKLFGGADEALYEAKRTGKNKLVVCEQPGGAMKRNA
ncbi:GGDEF domain-containing protein [Paenibacillus chartarius]|uniref:GGDEF domain-containing protein n=1 Tax=Paenibacillus chartarius TaxID=747481 RepID=A0ABV6DK21_9BACL